MNDTKRKYEVEYLNADQDENRISKSTHENVNTIDFKNNFVNFYKKNNSLIASYSEHRIIRIVRVKKD